MARSKRPAFVFPELESRGRRTILRSTEEVTAELDALETVEEEEDVKERVKVTYRFRPDAVEAVEDIRRILDVKDGLLALEDGTRQAIVSLMRDLRDNLTHQRTCCGGKLTWKHAGCQLISTPRPSWT